MQPFFNIAYLLDIKNRATIKNKYFCIKSSIKYGVETVNSPKIAKTTYI